MAKALKTVGVVAGVVAVVATGGAAIGALAGGTMLFAGVSAITIATVAAVTASVASLASQALTKPPPARGSITQVVKDPNAPSPYVMGEGYVGGVIRHDVGYGPTIKDVPNPYRFMVQVYSVAGPVESISPRVEFETIGGWFNNFLFTDTQLGATPEADALTPQWSGAPGWGTDYKLSGLAAIGWSFLFDKDGERFASGIPLTGAYGQWVKVYDPRLDDSQPGGAGSHVLGDESTYEWSENPALHAAMYAYGRYQNGNGPLLDGTGATGKRVMGVGLPADGIDWVNVMGWANTCDTNEWTIFGRVFEGGANEASRRWANLKDICFAGGAEPIPGGILSFKYQAPIVALDTITTDDLTDDDRSLVAMRAYRDRLNTVVPQYISAANNWELVDAEPVVNSTFLSEDGEEKREVWPFNLVKDKDQAAQLAAYRLFESREIAPITLVCKPRLRAYRPGECLHIDLPELALDTDAIILSRTIDPVTMFVTLELMGETPSKHAFCLGQVGVAPPTPALGQTAEERDKLAARANEPIGYAQARVRTVSFRNPRDASDVSRQLLVATEDSSVVTISIAKFDADYIGAESDATFGVKEITTLNDGITPLAAASLYYPYMDYNPLTGGTPTYGIALNALDAQNSATNPLRHAFGRVETPADGSGGTSGGSSGTGGGGGIPPDDTFE